MFFYCSYFSSNIRLYRFLTLRLYDILTMQSRNKRVKNDGFATKLIADASDQG